MSEPTPVGASADMAVEFEVISPTPLLDNPLAGVGILLHKKFSPAPDVGDPNTVMISDWNDRHVFGSGTNGQVLTRDSASPDGASWQTPVSADAPASAPYLLASPDASLINADVFTVAPNFNFVDGLLTLEDNGIGNLKLRDSLALSVIGRTEDYDGDPADIVAGTNGHVLRRSGDALSFGSLDLANSDTFTGILPASKIDPSYEGTPGPPGADGATGPAGPTGPAGATGTAGVGVPVGGATGQILSKTSATDYATGWIDPPAGGGGSVDVLWVGTDPPTDPDIELWADTDEPAVSSGGGSWPFGPITPLDQSTWEWVNQGDAFVVQANGLVYMETGVASPQNLTARVRAIPTAPYVITAAFINAVGLTTFSPRTGLCLRNSATGQLITLAYLGGNGNFELLRFNSPFSYNGQYAARNIAAKPALAYLRLSDDGTTRRAYESLDGFNFRLLHEGSRTDFFTPDQIGIFAGRESGAICAFSVLSWIQS